MSEFDIARIIQQIAILVPGFLVAVTVHEFAHGYVALQFGDPTAKQAGRLTINPISHIDPFGALALIITQMIGWAKPVPVDPRYLRNPRQDMVWISLAGPASNFITAAVCAALLHALIYLVGSGFVTGQPGTMSGSFLQVILYCIVINIGLGVFNLIPIPPLDGSKILEGILPRALAYEYQKIEAFGFIILLLLVFTGVVRAVVAPPIRFLVNLLLGEPVM